MILSHFAEQLRLATNEKQACILFDAYLKNFEFKRYAFTYYANHTKTGNKLIFEYASDLLMPWHNYYLEQGYADIDRTLETSHTLTLPLFWDIKKQLSQSKNKREHRMRQESLEFGVDKGLSIPVHGPHQDYATLTLHQFKNETCLENYREHQFEWQSAAMIFYHYLKKIVNLTEPKTSSLTKREKQCIILTAKSWRVEQIAKELGISSRTVNFHIQNANKKLGSNNKYQSVNKYFST